MKEFQLCQPFIPNKVIYPCIAQPKINGTRTSLEWDDAPPTDLFGIPSFKLNSKHGLTFNVPHIVTIANEGILNRQFVYDGELYLRGYKNTAVSGASRNKNNPINPRLSLILFDLMMDIPQKDRLSLLAQSTPFEKGLAINHESWKEQTIYILESIILYNDNEARDMRDYYISLGFEGIILRNMNAKYEYGIRSHQIHKYKKELYGYFTVLDLISKAKDTHLPLFICQNDITDGTFECVPTGTHSKQMKLFANKKELIGKKVLVKYYERSETGLPFNANVITTDL